MTEDIRILLVGHMFPKSFESKILNQEISPVQTQKFGAALLEAIQEGIGKHVDVFSVAPLLDFPHSHFIIAPGAIWKLPGGIGAVMMPFINVTGLKHASRLIVTLIYVFYWSVKNFWKKRIILMHGVQSCKLWGVLLGQALISAKTFSFITDGLGLPLNWEGSIKRGLRRLDVLLMKQGLKGVSGIVAMTPWLAESLAPGRPYLVINTIMNSADSPVFDFTAEHDGTFKIAYAGGLYGDYGIDLLIQTFALASHASWRLIIAGYGDREEFVRSAARVDSRIEYRGLLGDSELSLFYKSANVLINPRPVSTMIARMAFPSKIVDYLRTGKPVVTTPLPSFSDELKRHLIVASSDRPEDLLSCLEDVAAWPMERLSLWRAETDKYINEQLAPFPQGKRIWKFIEPFMKHRKQSVTW